MIQLRLPIYSMHSHSVCRFRGSVIGGVTGEVIGEVAGENAAGVTTEGRRFITGTLPTHEPS